MTKIKEIITKFEGFAPSQIAENGDPIGLQLGNIDEQTKRILVTLDVRPETVQEAIEKNCDFIFAHHPAMFVPVKKFDLNNPQNKMYAEILKNNITVYGAHTNLDNANGGMNDWLADKLQLINTEPLLPKQQYPNSTETYGMGRVGILKEEMSALEFAKYCKKVFNLKGARLITAASDKNIKKVAILGGSGGRFYTDALRKGADAYVTGDISYHTGHDIVASGLTAVDVGHHVEEICIGKLADLFEKWVSEEQWDVQILKSEVNTDPYQYI